MLTSAQLLLPLQTHVTFTHLMQQVDSTAKAASMVAAALQAEHAAPSSSSGSVWAVLHPLPQAAGPAGADKGSSSRAARAQARRAAFVRGALARCCARLQGRRATSASGGSSSSGHGSTHTASQAAATAAAAAGGTGGSGRGTPSAEQREQQPGVGTSTAQQPACYTVHEQVQRVIGAAVSLDNLARMYEGWTPWL